MDKSLLGNWQAPLKRAGAYWVGQDGNVWVKGDQGVNSAGRYDANSDAYWGSRGYAQIADPALAQQSSSTSTGASTYDAEAAAEKAKEEAERGKLRGEITSRGSEIDKIYRALFGDLEKLVRARDRELEEEYGGQLSKATEQYAAALPQIEASYASIGAADSTDLTTANRGAEGGFKETTETIGKNKKADKAKLGQYSQSERAKFEADQRAARRNIERAGDTTDVDALRSMRNSLETNLDTAGVTRATLGTDQGARGKISELTQDAGRYEQAIGALESVLKGSMSGAVKQAAVEAVADSTGLSADERKKVKQTYGDVYSEQAAL